MRAKQLLDSALLVAAISAFLYAIGFLGDLRDARDLRLPLHLLPESPAQATILYGAVDFILLGLPIAGLYVVLAAAWSILPQPSKSWLQQRFQSHKIFYSILGCLCLGTTMIVLAVFLPVPRTSHQDKALPVVVRITFKNGPQLSPSGLEYLSHRDHLLVLKHKGKQEFLILNDAEITSIELTAGGD